MNANLTELLVILDRSGSMASRKTDAEGGVNGLIEKQKLEAGECNFTLVQFDDEYEVVHSGKSIKEVEANFSLDPRGGTALLDAIGKTINETGSRLSKLKEEDRPGLVMFVIVTDGYENASKEFKGQQIKEMIAHQTDIYKWKFVYLGANQDAFAVGGAIGIGSSTGYVNTAGAMGAASNLVTRGRQSVARGKEVDLAYTSAELTSMK